MTCIAYAAKVHVSGITRLIEDKEEEEEGGGSMLQVSQNECILQQFTVVGVRATGFL